MIEKIFPHNLEAEVNVLGAMIQFPECISEIILILKSEDFYKEQNKIIYDCLMKLYLDNIKIDVVTLNNNIRKVSSNEVVPITYIANVIETCISPFNSSDHALIVKEHSTKRKALKTFYAIIEDGYRDDVSSKELLNKATEELFKMQVDEQKPYLKDISEVLEVSVNKIQEMFITKKMPGWKTNLTILDNVLCNLQRKDLVILAARPAMGKTAFELYLAIELAKQKIKTLIFSIEMSNEQLMDRIIASQSLIKYDVIKSGQLETHEWEKISNTCGWITNLPITFNDKGDLSVDEIYSYCRKLKMQKGLDQIFIDHLQIIRLQNTMSRNDAIGEVTRKLKIIAKELDINVMLLSQLSRACEVRVDKRPMLSDLRDSGNIEQDADVVLSLFREEYYDIHTTNKNVVELGILKNRNGKTGYCECSFLGEYQRFCNLIKI